MCGDVVRRVPELHNVSQIYRYPNINKHYLAKNNIVRYIPPSELGQSQTNSPVSAFNQSGIKKEKFEKLWISPDSVLVQF